MCTKFLLKVFSYKSGRCKLFSQGKNFLCAPIKSYPFLRSTASVASEVNRKDDETGTKCQGAIIPQRKSYFLGYLLNQEEYRSLILDPDNLNFETEGRPESVHILQNLTSGTEDEELIGKLKSSLLKDKEILNVEEICKTLFWTFKHKNNNLAQEIFSLLETVLVKSKLSNAEIIKVLFTLNETWGKVQPNSFLHMKLSSKMCFRINNLTPKQIIAVFYCKLRITKEVLKNTNFNITNQVTNIIPSLDSVELGIVVNSLLHNKISFYSFQCRKNFWQRTMELSGSLDEVPLLSICRFLKKNVTFHDGSYLLEFQERLIPNLSKYNYLHLNQVAAAGIEIGCLNSSLWAEVANKYKEKINDFTLEKMLSLVTIITECNVDDEEMLKLATEKFERAVEDGSIDHANNRRHLVMFLYNLIHHRIYPKKLLDVVFAEGLTFFKPDVKYGYVVKAKYWETKCFLDIDKPELNYNSFSEKEAIKLYKLCYYVLHTTKHSVFDQIYYALKTMETILTDLYGDDEKVYLSSWHPVYPRGIFLRFDQNLNAQPIPADFRSLDDYYPKKALKDDHIWAFIILSPRTCCFGAEKVRLSALSQMRHLQTFGYEPILVQYNAFKNQINENTAKEYLNNIINEHLHKTSRQKAVLGAGRLRGCER